MPITGIESCITGALDSKFFMKNYIYSSLSAGAGNNSYMFFSTWQATGVPSPFPDIPLIGYTFDTTTGGILPDCGIPFDQPEPNKKLYLGYVNLFERTLSVRGAIIFCDRIWQSQQIAVTGRNITFSSPTWPARDANQSSSGEGFLVGLELTQNAFPVPGGNLGDGVVFTYTNSKNNANRTGVFRHHSFNVANNFLHRNTFFTCTLSPGDTGIKSIDSYSNSGLFAATYTGSGMLAVYRPIDYIDFGGSVNGYNKYNRSIIGPKYELYSGTTPFLLVAPFAATATGKYFGMVSYISV